MKDNGLHFNKTIRNHSFPLAQSSCTNLDSCVELIVEYGQKTEGQEAHHQEVCNQDVVPDGDQDDDQDVVPDDDDGDDQDVVPDDDDDQDDQDVGS